MRLSDYISSRFYSGIELVWVLKSSTYDFYIRLDIAGKTACFFIPNKCIIDKPNAHLSARAIGGRSLNGKSIKYMKGHRQTSPYKHQSCKPKS